jgi:hypothetical protein
LGSASGSILASAEVEICPIVGEGNHLLVKGGGALEELATFPENCAVMSVPHQDAKADAESSNAEPATTANRTENTFDRILIGV